MTAAGVLQDHQNMEKQSGCMSGFLQIFDRHQFLAGKRVYATTKRLSPSPATDSASSQSGKPEEDPKDREFEVQLSPPVCVKPETATPTNVSPKMPLEFKQGLKSSWKFKESPRLSLDSRAIVDAKGSLYPREIRTTSAMLDATSEDENDKQRRSPSVVARLMGLEALPESTTREPFKKQQPELTRCASESRSRDLLRFVDVNNFHYRSEAKVEQKNKSKSDQISPWNQQQQQQHKYFDRQDFFPEVKQKESVYGELEKRLKMRGINEGAEDLETLKQILEALQLKGLLHSRRKVEKINNHRNFVYDETPIILTKSCNKTRVATQSPPSNSKTTNIRRNVNLGGSETSLPVRRRQDRSLDDRSPRSGRKFSNSMSPDRSESNARSPCSPARRKQLSVDTQKRRNESVEHRCNSPVRSPKITPRKNSSDQVSKSPRNNNRRSSLSSTVEICSKERFEDESSSISESSTSTTSHFDIKDYKEGKTLLQRCDKLLNSIAEIATTTTTESQPSPVSVLDSSFYKDELSPLKRCLDFKDQLEEDHWSPVTSPVRIKSNDADYVYVFEILEASKRISQESNLFNLLEKQRYKNDCNSGSRLHRKLVFDTVAEILNKNKKLPLPPWKGVSCRDNTPFRQVWLEFEKMRERASSSEDMLEVICMALQRDLAEETINGWGECTKEKSEMVLDIERLIFKDMVGEAIQDLATFSGRNRGLVPKKLVF